IFEIPSLTRGGAGMPATRPDGWASGEEFTYLCFIFLALVIYVDWRFLRSKVGRAVLAIKHSEPVAASYGINVTYYKVLAFTMSGLFAGVAGSLFAFHSQNVVSNDFSFANATLWVLMVVVGGLGNRVGVVIASAFFALFPFILELWTGFAHYIEDLGRAMGNVTIVVGAVLALLTIIQYPGGIGEQVSPITRWIGGKRFSLHPEGHGPPKHDEPKASGGGLLGKLGLHKEPNGQRETSQLQALGRAVERPSTDNRAPQRPRSSSSSSTSDPEVPDVWGALTRKKGGNGN
ncbi:MAG: branched-chain amino acid ABC transporter permease, partial [Actinomycetota bacterium]